MKGENIKVLLVDEDSEFATAVKSHLKNFEDAQFEVLWEKSGEAALQELEGDQSIDAVVMDYVLPGRNGLEIVRALREKGLGIPVVFLTQHKDTNLAIEAMKLGVQDYLVKQEIPALPKTILRVAQKRKLQREVAELEIRKKRLEAMQELIGGIANEFTVPLQGMKNILESLVQYGNSEKTQRYLSIIDENLKRMETTLEKLQNLKDDKTVRYIKDIKMIDLS